MTGKFSLQTVLFITFICALFLALANREIGGFLAPLWLPPLFSLLISAFALMRSKQSRHKLRVAALSGASVGGGTMLVLAVQHVVSFYGKVELQILVGQACSFVVMQALVGAILGLLLPALGQLRSWMMERPQVPHREPVYSEATDWQAVAEEVPVERPVDWQQVAEQAVDPAIQPTAGEFSPDGEP